MSKMKEDHEKFILKLQKKIQFWNFIYPKPWMFKKM